MKHIVRLCGINVNLCVVRTDDEAIDLYTQWMNDENINMYKNKQNFVFKETNNNSYYGKKFNNNQANNNSQRNKENILQLKLK